MALPAPPTYEALAVPEDQTDPRGKRLPRLIAGYEWLRYWLAVSADVDEKPARKASVSRTAQTASIATTAIPLDTTPPGIWRVSYRFRVTTPAGVSSTLSFTLSWTEGGVAQTETSAAATGNTTGTHQFGTLVIRIGNATAISFATTYASNPVGAMVYNLDVIVEALALD